MAPFHRKTLVIILAVAGALLVLGTLDRWMGSLAFEVRLRRLEFYSGEPVVATILWRNESKVSLEVGYWGVFKGPLGYYWGVDRGQDLGLVVTFEDGQNLKSHARELDIAPGAGEPLLPGREVQRLVRLERAFDLSRQGEYSLQVAYDPWLADSEVGLVKRWLAKRFRSVSESRFRIIPWKESSLSDASERAKAGDPGGARLLGLHGAEDSVVLLLMCLASENLEARYEAAHALGRIGSPSAIRGLGEAAVKESNPKLKSEMVYILRDLGSPETFPWLRKMLEDTVVVRDFTYPSGDILRFYPLRALTWSYLRNRGEEVEAQWEEVVSGSESSDER